MPLWFSLAVYGTNAYARPSSARSHGCCVREYIETVPYLELVRRRLRSWSSGDRDCPSGLHNAWSTDLLAAQRGFVTPTTGRAPAARLAILHPDTDMAMPRASRHHGLSSDRRWRPRAGGPRGWRELAGPVAPPPGDARECL